MLICGIALVIRHGDLRVVFLSPINAIWYLWWGISLALIGILYKSEVINKKLHSRFGLRMQTLPPFYAVRPLLYLVLAYIARIILRFFIDIEKCGSETCNL